MDDLDMLAEARMAFQLLANRHFLTDQKELHSLKPVTRPRDARQHHRQPVVAAHRIDGDPGLVGHDATNSVTCLDAIRSCVAPRRHAVDCVSPRPK
jgi:hypothetical protein